MERYFVGIDNGGTNIKAAVFSSSGQQMSAASEQTPVTVVREGYHERDMIFLWEKTTAAIQKAISASGIAPEKIAAVGCTGHGKGLYLWGKDGKPCAPAIASTDQRAAELVREWEQNGTTDRNNKNLQPPDWALNGLQPVGIPARGTTKRPISGEDMHYNMTRPFVTAATLPEMLKKCGYVTVHCGKAHFGTQGTPGSNPLNMGFDYNIAGTEIGHSADYRGSKHYGKGFNHVRGLDENNYYQDDVFLTEALTLEALKRLEAIRTNPKEAGKPFYLYMAQYALHAPLDERAYDKRFADSYKNPEDGHKWSPVEKHYSGLIEGMDKSLGDIMKYLKEHDMDKNTVLVFMSDNGGLAISGRLGNEDANYPLSFGKGSCMEGGIREPMIVSWPGVTKGGSRCAVPVVIDDFFPTLLDIAGCRNAKVPQKLDGLSLVPLLKGGRFPADRPLLFHQPNNWGENNRQAPQYGASTALRHGDWKLIYRHGNQSFELYNLKKDIGEKENLAAREPRKLKEMAGLMGKLLRERKAQMPTYKKGNELGAPEGSSVPWPDQVKKGGN